MTLLQRIRSNSILADRRLLASSLIVAGGFFLGKVLGLFREVLVAQAFGTGGDLDAFIAATSFSDLLFAVVAGGAVASVFIPVFSGYLVRDEAARIEGWRFASAVVNDIFLAVTLFSLLGMLFAPRIVGMYLAPGFPPERQALTAELLRLVLVSTIVFGVSGTITGVLHAHSHFLLPALSTPLYNLAIIGSALFLVPFLGIWGLTYGLIAGSALHLLIQVPALIRHRARYSLTLGTRQAGVHMLLRLMGPRVVTMAVVRVNTVIMTAFASHLAEGSVSALGFAYSLWQFPETLIGTAIALAVFPRLSARAAEGNAAELRKTYRGALFSIVALAAPAALVTVAFARPIVALLFQRGAFGQGSTEVVATVLQFYALAILGESLLELTARIFYAQKDARTPMWVAIATMAVRALLMLWWSEPLGAPGLALAYAVGVTLEGSALYALARRRTSRPVSKREIDAETPLAQGEQFE